MTLDAGSTFAGRYLVGRRIAEGGMGAVYEVTHRETGRRRALKVLHPHVLRDRKAREQFRREARIGGVIESEAIVDVFDAGIDDATGTPFLVMELLKGEDLARRVERVGPLAAGEVVEHLRQVSRALDRAHAAGVVHRDLKPENLFLHQRETGAAAVKILDFGVAKIVQDERKSGDTLSVGTPMFMAPEQFTGSYPVTGAVDRYAVAHVAYALLVGEPYFDPEAEAETAMLAFMSRVVAGATEAPSRRALTRRRVRLPSTFDAWFFRATAVDPARRPASMQDLVDGLELALGISFSEAPTVAMRLPEIAPARGRQESGAGSDPPAAGALRSDTISGTTTPHRPQRASRSALLLGAAAAGAAAVALGTLGYYAALPADAPTAAPAAQPLAPVEDVGAQGPAASASPSIVITPTAAADPMPSSVPSATASAAASTSAAPRPSPRRPSPRPATSGSPPTTPSTPAVPYTRD